MTDDNKEGGAGKDKSAVGELGAKAAEIGKWGKTNGAKMVRQFWTFGMHRIEDVAEARVRGRSKGEIIRKFENAAADAVLAGRDPAEIRQMRDGFIAEQTLYYDNIKAIGNRAAPNINEDAKAENVRKDTITHLREKGKIVSDEEMQEVLAGILAEEMNTPGSFSKKTIDVVSSLDRSDVEMFSQLCSFAVKKFVSVENPNSPVALTVVISEHLLIFNEVHKVYQGKGITFTSLQDLASLGLLTYTSLGTHMPAIKTSMRWGLSGNGFSMIVEVPAGQTMDYGRVMLTRAGKELSRICKSEIVPEFSSYIMEEYKERGLKCQLLKEDMAI